MLTVPETEVVVARERELARLNGYLEWAMSGQGSAVFVTGEAGAGKTTLIKEFIRQAQQNNDELLFAMGNCNAQTGMSDPYLPFCEILNVLTGDIEAKLAQGSITSEGAQRLHKFFQISVEVLVEFGPTLINTLVPGAGLVSRFGLFAAKKLGWLDKLKKLTTTETAEKPELSQEHIFEQYTAVLQAIAVRRPLVLWLDDLHWVDAASASLLFHLGRALEKSRILVLGTYRSEDVALGRDAEPHPLTNVINEFKRYWGDIQIDLDLARVSEGRHFVNALLDAQPNGLDEPFRQALFKHTGGLPLFTVELLHDLQERAELVPDAAGRLVAISTLDWNSLPARVEGIIEKRISRLDSDLQETLMTASIEGERFTVEIVAQVLNRPARELVRQLSGDADKKHRLVQALGSQRVGEQRLSLYQFRHSLIQKYLYNRLDAVERAYLHQEMGYALEALCADLPEMLQAQLEELAHHFHSAAVWPKALAYAQRAGEKALALFAPQTAVEQFTRALTAAGNLNLSPPPTVLYRLRGKAFDTLGEFDRARADYEAALQIAHTAGDQRAQWQSLLDLGLLWASRDYERSGAYSRQALELARLMEDQAAIGHSLNRLGNWLMNSGQAFEALGYHREALDIFETIGDPAGIAATLDLMAMTSNQSGDIEWAVTYWQRAIPILRELNDRQTLSSSLANVVMYTLDLEQAHEAIELARDIGWHSGEAYALGTLSQALFALGRYGEALSVRAQSLEIAQAIEHPQWMASGHIYLGLQYAELLAPDEAQEQLEQGLALARQVGSLFFVWVGSAGLASVYMLQGRLEAAESLLTELPQEWIPALLWARLAQAELAMARQDATRMLQLLDDPLKVPRASETAIGLLSFAQGPVLTLYGQALTLQGRFDEAEQVLHEVRNLYITHGIAQSLWKIHLALGKLYLAIDRPEQADPSFAAARAQVDELAATLTDKDLRENFRRRANALIPSA